MLSLFGKRKQKKTKTFNWGICIITLYFPAAESSRSERGRRRGDSGSESLTCAKSYRWPFLFSFFFLKPSVEFRYGPVNECAEQSCEYMHAGSKSTQEKWVGSGSSSGSKNTISALSSAARCVPSPALHFTDYSSHAHTHAVCPDLKLLWITACSNKAIIFPTTLPRSASRVKSFSGRKEAQTPRASSRHSRRWTWARLISDCCHYSPSAPSLYTLLNPPVESAAIFGYRWASSFARRLAVSRERKLERNKSADEEALLLSSLVEIFPHHYNGYTRKGLAQYLLFVFFSCQKCPL